MTSTSSSSSSAADGALSVEGAVILAYPLRQLKQKKKGTGDFTQGDGPCGGVAQQVLTLEIENPRCGSCCCWWW